LPRIPKVFPKDRVPHGPPESHNEPSNISTRFRQTRLFEIEPQSAFQGVLSLLKRLHYQVEPCEDKYILAKHLTYDKNVFIVVAPHEEYANYERVRSIVIDLQNFVDVIVNLNRAYEKLSARSRRVPKRVTLKLLRDVITAFGWHVYETESSRHTALERSTNSYDELHIENLLRWLRNTWSDHKMLRKYAEIAASDYRWFQTEFGRRAYAYRSRKRELKANLRTEFDRLLSQGKLVTNINQIHNYFVVKYRIATR